MSGIIDTETGEYLITGTPASTGPIVPPVGADELPQKQADPYRGVDHRAWDAAPGMTAAQALQMAAIAESRHDPQAAMAWKGHAVEIGQRNLVAEGQATLQRQAANRYRGPQGPGIVEPTEQTPWSADPEYQGLTDRLAEVQAIAGWADDPDARTEVAALRSHRRVRQQAVVTEARAAGQWTDQDANTFAAQQSLASKAAQIETMLKSG
jgi:hypothetical protein